MNQESSYHIKAYFQSEVSWDSLRFIQEFFEKKGKSIQVSSLFDDNQLAQVATLADLENLPSDISAVRFDIMLSQSVLSAMPALPETVRFLGVADVFLRENGQWWPHVLLVEAVRNLIVKQARYLDIREACFVIGVGPLAVAMASILLGLGYKRLSLVSEQIHESQEDIERLRQFFWGVEVEHVPASALTAQATPASCLIIAQDLSDNSTLVTDISYFNFMKRGGLVIDLNLNRQGVGRHGVNAILEEAKSAELKVISPIEIYGYLIYEFIKKLGLAKYCLAAEIIEAWCKYYKEKNSTGV